MIKKPGLKIKYLIYSIILSIAFILAIELFLRIGFGFPTSLFYFISRGNKGLYAPNSTILMTYGHLPYMVKTNSLDLRGKEIPFKRLEDRIRIAALGDSVTDGMYVDNDATYPYLLENILNAKNKSVEVLNAARGGGSIDKEYAVLKEIVMPLKPDIILLTFITNDISEIKGKSRKDLLSMTMRHKLHLRVVQWFLTRTAIGELTAELYLRARYKFYRFGNRNNKGIKLNQDRYKIGGGDDYAANINLFNVTFANTDGLVLNEPFSKRTTALIDNYLFALKHMRNLCQHNDIELIFIYFPGYPQVYDLDVSFKIRDVLKDACKRLSIPFIDLTVAFRKAGKDKVLHIAPVDFHLNPDGYRVMAEAIAEFLTKENLLKQK